MKKIILSFLLISALFANGQERTLSGFEPITGRPGFKIKDTVKRLYATSPVYFLNDSTITVDTSRLSFTVAKNMSNDSIIFSFFDGTRVAVSSGGSSGAWSYNGSKIYYNDGYVGVGTINALSKFSVVKDGIGNPTITTYGLDTTGLSIGNNTATLSTVTLQQSPPLSFFWNSWNTSTSASIENRIRYIGQSVTGAGGNGNFLMQYSTGGGAYITAYTYGMNVNSNTFSGSIAAASLQSTGNITATAGGVTAANGLTSQAGSSGAGTNNTNAVNATGAINPSAGTKIFNAFYYGGTIASTGGTTTITGFNFSPTVTSTTGSTIYGFKNTVGDNLFGTTSGSVGVGANTSINASAILDITSTTKGVLMPRMTATQASAITKADGLIVYVTNTDATFTSLGFWGCENNVWIKL